LDFAVIRYFEEKMAAVPVDPYFAACLAGRMDEVRRLLDDGYDVDRIDTKRPDISTAEIFKHIDEYHEAKKKFPWLESYGKAAIHIAMESMNEPLLRLLGERNADIYLAAQSGDKREPLQIGIKKGFMTGIRYLTDEKQALEHWPDREKGPESLLIDSAEIPDSSNAIAMLRFFIEEKHLDWRKARSVTNLSLLHRSELRRTTEVTEYLLDLDWDLGEDTGPVIWLDDEEADSDFTETVNKIFRASGGTGPSFQERIREQKKLDDLFGGLPLNRVAWEGDMPRVKLYLAHGANPFTPNMQGQNAFDAVAAVFEVEAAKLDRWTRRGMEESCLQAQRERIRQFEDIMVELVKATTGNDPGVTPPPAVSGPG
jgi:hypothetical protein